MQTQQQIQSPTVSNPAISETAYIIERAAAEPEIRSINAEIARRCRESLFYFEKYFWTEITEDEFKPNWHIKYLCQQLMDLASRVADGKPKEYDLIINVPPGTTKSITCSVMFPVWCWVNWPHLRFIVVSYSGNLSLEHAEYSRDLMRSDKFERIFPDLTVKADKDTKSNFRVQTAIRDEVTGEITGYKQGGNRYSTSVGGTVTGFHGHILIVDDPLDPNRAVSDIELHKANHFVDQTLSTRKVEKAVTPTVVIMQRLHQNDPSGHILARSKGKVRHVCLPGEIENFKEQVRPIDLILKYKDGLLDPNRMPWEVLEGMESDLGQYGYAGQVGQSPTPPGGGMFQVDMFSEIEHPPHPSEIERIIRYWDKAGTDPVKERKRTKSWTVGTKMARLKNGRFVILDERRGQWSSDKREAIIKSTAEADGVEVEVWVEQEPGSGGKESAQGTILNLAGFIVHKEPPVGNKPARADTFSVQVNAGNVSLLKGDWTHEFKEEFRFFPFGTTNDRVDSASGAFNKLVSKKQVQVG
jgi:predicted phage terminase large subunit-like protein